MTASDRLKPLLPGPVRTTILRRRMAIRGGLRLPRMLPAFLVIGAQRSGTSSLYKYLSQHPDLSAPLRKEIGYFSRSYGMSLSWYRSHFPLAARPILTRRFLGHDLATFEATPDYLFHPLAAPRAHALLPEVKLVVLLRDPVARAASQYQHMVRLGFEQLTFEDALAAEDERIAADLERIHTHPDHHPRNLLRFSYVHRGLYADQLQTWQRHYPRHRFLVLPSERMYDDPAGTYAEILGFLGLRPWAPRSFPNYSATGLSPRPEDPLTPSTRRHLAERFHRPNQDLFDLLGTTFAWPGTAAG